VRACHGFRGQVAGMWWSVEVASTQPFSSGGQRRRAQHALTWTGACSRVWVFFHLWGCESVTWSGLGGLGWLSESSLDCWSGGIVIQVVVVVVIRDPCADCLGFRSQD